MTSPRELKALYERGTNIIAYLWQEAGVERGASEIIEISYDLQTGSYIAALDDSAYAKYEDLRTREVARIILGLCAPASILEAGIGEATTLAAVVRHMNQPEMRSYGFDLSWSRAAYARGWLLRQGIPNATVCTGDLQHVPFADDSIDLVYTCHAIEANRGREESVLRELFRIARKYVLLMEPAYELGSDEARARMDQHGYCRGLKETATSLGYEVLEHSLFPYSLPPINPTALTLIRKKTTAPLPSEILACPKFKTPLLDIGGAWFSPEALAVYPVIGGIPCLRIENAILASKYAEFMKGA